MENKSFGKKLPLNFFDIIIIVIIIAAAGIFIFMQTRDSGSQQGTGAAAGTVEYQVEIVEISDATRDMIKPGDKIVDKVKKYNIGTVKDVVYYPAKRQAINFETGDILYSELPDKQSACITITADCTHTESAVIVDSGFEVKTGTEMSILGPGYAGAGYIIGVARGDE